MFYIKKIIYSIILFLCFMFITSCDFSGNDFDYIESGTRIELSMTNYSDYINAGMTKLEVSTCEGFFDGLKIKFKSSGYSAFSYFYVGIKTTISALALNDMGTYEEISFTYFFDLDENGYAEGKENIEFGTLYRNIKDLRWEVSEIDGFIVKK